LDEIQCFQHVAKQKLI